MRWLEKNIRDSSGRRVVIRTNEGLSGQNGEADHPLAPPILPRWPFFFPQLSCRRVVSRLARLCTFKNGRKLCFCSTSPPRAQWSIYTSIGENSRRRKIPKNGDSDSSRFLFFRTAVAYKKSGKNGRVQRKREDGRNFC
ncbi:hypothetical protein CAEBREN_25840 [Caenorhabditis brenneri]|uniref:Uncharacterized protein n=1 Tax=Caenorhabditis brenneri TaxID=135651 RepID=G0M6W7_CAEBE|nr:hypothetical protein CAEBREN_25840 [Caenorhabditis brenneri]